MTKLVRYAGVVQVRNAACTFYASLVGQVIKKVVTEPTKVVRRDLAVDTSTIG